jgi:hypothetical protein
MLRFITGCRPQSLTLALGLACTAVAALAQPVAAQGKPPAFHIVLETRPDLPRFLQLLEMRMGVCSLAVQGMGRPAPKVVLPPAAVLAQHAGIRVERWFDGARYAEFQTTNVLEPDADRDCELSLRREFLAVVEPGLCVAGVRGSAAGGALRSGAPAQRAPLLVRDDEMSAEEAQLCKERPPKRKPRQLVDVATLAKTPTVAGVGCVWEDELTGAATPPSYRVCLHPGTPYFPVPSGRKERREVGLKWTGPPSQGQAALLGGEVGDGYLEAVAFRQLAKAPEAVFTATAVEQHIRQSLWLPWSPKH